MAIPVRSILRPTHQQGKHVLVPITFLCLMLVLLLNRKSIGMLIGISIIGTMSLIGVGVVSKKAVGVVEKVVC